MQSLNHKLLSCCLVLTLSLAGCAANPTADNLFGEAEPSLDPALPDRPSLYEELAACKGNELCQTAAIEEFRAYQRRLEMAIGIIGSQPPPSPVQHYQPSSVERRSVDIHLHGVQGGHGNRYLPRVDTSVIDRAGDIGAGVQDRLRPLDY